MNYAFLIVLVLSITLAAWRGGPPEKWGAATLTAMTAVQVVGIVAIGWRLGKIDLVALTVDLVGFAAFTAIALFARRVWPLWASALQLFSLTTHFVRASDFPIHPIVYWLMKSAPTFGICLILIAATHLHRRRLIRDGGDPSWTVWRDRGVTGSSTRTIRRF